MPTDLADTLIHELGATISRSPRINAVDWQQLALVATIQPEYSRMTGFAYDRGGEVLQPIAPGGFDAIDKAEALRTAMAADGSRPWVTCLIRLRRDTGAITVDFEYDDASRWAITPSNVAEMAQTLRPPAS
jgi:hypothetical protein